jgi:hypothetical protein
MSIRFLPNDPLATDAPLRTVTPRADRPTNGAHFTFTGSVAEDVYNLDTPEFLFWQCREGALAAVETWEGLTGQPLRAWQRGPRLALLPDAGVDLNAFYDRRSLSFFHFPVVNKVYLSGASTDVVAHEAGHALLDSLRPDFWNSNLFEVNALHEAFGDCVAILTALADTDTRTTVLHKLTRKNFVEATAEYLADGIKKVAPNHNAAAPRRALNKFQWQLPSTLPDFGSADDGPGVLINEIHSFGQVFSGCFYSLIVNLFKRRRGKRTAANLLAAAQTAGRLLIRGVTQAPQKARFFREVGRAMVLADQQDNRGANGEAIEQAFEAHGITLGTGAMLAPQAALAGAAPKVGARVTLGAPARRDLLGRIGAAGARLALSPLEIGKERVAEAVHERLVPLDRLHKKLRGVVAGAPESVLVGDSGGRAAVLGALPEPATTADEVSTFVRSLVKQGAIQFGPPPSRPRAAVAGLTAAARPEKLPPPITHAIQEVRGQKTLVRLRFACPCGGLAQ